ncbi:MAG TPA: N-6 DNA methylase [Bacteroidota bacterium]|nr:N-6 DNA methylase [Bacteroidota bacterium]
MQSTEELNARDSLVKLADNLVKKTADLVRNANTEEDLRIGFEKILEPIKNSIGIESYPKYEKSVYKGRSDAVHGQMVIEYEFPNSFSSKKNVDHTFEQLIDYLIGESINIAIDKLLGVGFDGQQIFFVQYQDQKDEAIDRTSFTMHGPYDFDQESARTFLIHLRALSRLPLTSDNLAQRFGSQSQIAPKAISAFVNSLQHWGRTSQIQTFFNEWKRLFGIVYGAQFNNYTGKEKETLLKTYKIEKEVDFQELLFCIHTYFALLMKLITAEILTLRDTSFSASYTSELVHISDDALLKQLEDIENGGTYAKKGVVNFLEGDFFRWYIDTLESLELMEAIREIARELSQFEAGTSILVPDTTRDLLKKLYQYLVPQDVRHQLGEYYTPDWLAELLLDEIEYDGDNFQRVLDPSCGSGTFLVLAIHRAKEWGRQNKRTDLEIAKSIKDNIWGFDLNPMAVIAARTNYLFALGDLTNEILNSGGILEIPIYLADSVLWPENTLPQMKLRPHGEPIEIQTSIGEFYIPSEWIADKGLLFSKATPLIEIMIKERYSIDEAMTRLRNEGLVFQSNQEVVKNLYIRIFELENSDQNGIWARFLKDMFAPVVAGKFDFVVGNPPWVRWDYLSQSYRDATLPLWKNYGLFSLKGFQSRLGGGKKDFSMLFVYAASDYYLKNDAKLGFLITQEVFKSKGAGEGFRRFQLGNKEYLKVVKAHDFSAIQPFEGAVNKTAAIILKKGTKTTYPVPYYVWSRKKGVGKIGTGKSLKEAKQLLQKSKYFANPIGSEVGAWQTQPTKKDGTLKIEGKNYYKAVLGANPNPYGVFWLKITHVMANGNIIIQNLPEKGKLDIPKVEAVIEPGLVYPAIRGADIVRWGVDPKIYMLVVQDPETRRGFTEEYLKANYPWVFSYLIKFHRILLERALYKKYHKHNGAPFYSQFNISEKTFARYKVVWKAMSNDIYAAVISQFKTEIGYKFGIPLHTTSLIATDSKAEAHYICSIINSKPVRNFIKSFSAAGRGFGTPSIMEHIGIPQFDPRNPIHLQLSENSIKCHKLVSEGKTGEVALVENENDLLVAELFPKK